MRGRLQDAMVHLRKKYRAALKDDEMQRAFDELWPAWSTEQGAMIYAEVLSSLDLLLLTAAVDNRREIEALRRENADTRMLIDELTEASRAED
jgi:hypothetical protein